jgi:hypothetical protein
MHPRTPCFFGLWVLLSLLDAAGVADAMIEARQTFAKSRPLLPEGNYEDILDLLQEEDYAYTACDIPTFKGYATERGFEPSVTSDQQSEGVTCECWRNVAVLLVRLSLPH